MNLVLVVLDTTRPDWLSAYDHPLPTTPYLAEFAREATRFDRAYSSSSWTLPAHSTMFTGAPPGVHGATQSTAHIAADIPLLAETLAEAGYATAGFSANPWVGEKSGLDRGFKTFQRIQSAKHGWLAGRVDTKQASASEAADRVTNWLRNRAKRSEKSGEQPFFLFVNLMDAHHPYVPSPRAAKEFLGYTPETLRDTVGEFYPELPGGHARSLMNRHYERKSPLSEAEWERLIGLYKAALLSEDEELRAVMQAVDSFTDPAETLVLIVSDHGESFGEHGHFGHILNLYETTVRVVFLARGPGFEAGQTDEQPVHLADVHTTLLAAAGIASPDSTTGFDLMQERPRGRVVSAVLDPPLIQFKPFSDDVLESGVMDVYQRATWAAISERYKLIAYSDDTEELFDLWEDPGEEFPLDPTAWIRDGAAGSQDRRILDALRASVTEARAMQQITAGGDMDFDEETMEALRALGYLK